MVKEKLILKGIKSSLYSLLGSIYATSLVMIIFDSMKSLLDIWGTFFYFLYHLM